MKSFFKKTFEYFKKPNNNPLLEDSDPEWKESQLFFTPVEKKIFIAGIVLFILLAILFH